MFDNEVIIIVKEIWDIINGLNLVQNVLFICGWVIVILYKGFDYEVCNVWIRKV